MMSISSVALLMLNLGSNSLHQSIEDVGRRLLIDWTIEMTVETCIGLGCPSSPERQREVRATVAKNKADERAMKADPMNFDPHWKDSEGRPVGYRHLQELIIRREALNETDVGPKMVAWLHDQIKIPTDRGGCIMSLRRWASPSMALFLRPLLPWARQGLHRSRRSADR